MDNPQPSVALLHNLQKARPYFTDRYLPANYVEELSHICGRDDIARIDLDSTHPLWWVLPAVAHDLFGDTGMIQADPVVTRSLVLIPPPFIHLSAKLQSDLGKLGIKVEPAEREFTGCLVAMLYGGHPWFEPYIRLCEAKGYLAQPCSVFAVSGDRDIVRELRSFKDDNRERYAQPVRMPFDDLSYPGMIRAFHTPSRHENRRHLLAVKLA